MILPQILSFLFTLGAAYVVGQIFRPSAPAGPRDPGSEQRSRANPRAVLNALYGRWTTFGQEIYLGANADNTRGFYAIALGIIPPSSTISFNRVFADDIQLTLDADGNVVSGSDPNGNVVDKYNGRLRIIRYAGGRSTVLEAQPDWNETFIADRVAYAAVELDRDTTAGLVQLPQLRFTGSNSRNNPADAVEDMILDNRYGIAKDASLIGDSFAEHRAYCATEVAHLDRTGTVTVMDERFTVNGEIDCSQSVVDRCNEILAHQNATLGFYGGKYEIFTNRELPTTGLLDIDEDWFVSGFEFAENSASLFTQLRVDYGRNQNNQFQPGVLYRDVPTTLQHPSQQSRLDTISLPYCDNFVEASRVSAQYINEAFTGLTIRTTLDIRGIQLKPQQLVRVSSERYSFSQKLFQVKEIDELQEGTVLTYRVLLREYEPSNYTDDGTIQEEDPAPNIDFTEPSQITAVNDLSVVNVNQGADVPNFTLEWTVPTSLIDEFDIFFSTLNTFSSATRLRTVTNTTGPFASGTTVQEVITGLPAADYSFWVVGRNEFGMSAESNRAFLSWTPVVVTNANAEGIRHHENDVGTDPGAPTGADGTGGGWYDPTEGTTITTNRPADPDPHWEARGVGIIEGGQQEITDFDVQGISGDVTTVVTPDQQRHEVTTTGIAGQRVTIPAQQEQTRFTFTGFPASINAGGIGNVETWQIDVTGMSDAVAPPTTGNPEEFFIYLNGNSSSDVPPFYESTFTAPRTSSGSSVRFPFIDSVWSTETRMDLRGASTAQRLEIFNGLNTGNEQPETGSVSNTNGYRLAISNTARTRWGIYDFDSVSGVQTQNPNDVLFQGNFSFVAGMGAPQTNEQYQILFLDENATTIPMPSEVEIAVPEFILPETFQLTNDLTTSTALRDDLFNRLMDTFGTPVTISQTFAMETADSPQSNPSIFVRGRSTFTPEDNWPTTSANFIDVEVDNSDSSLLNELTSIVSGDTLEILNGGTVIFSARVTSQSTDTTSTDPVTFVGFFVADITVGAGAAIPAAGTALTLRRTPVTMDSRINNFFTITQGTATFADHGVQDGEPIILFVADRNQDVSVGVTFTSGTGGDLSGSAFGSHIEGNPDTEEGVPSAVRITYDSNLIPSFQDIVFGSAMDSTALATTLTSMIDSQPSLTATQGTAVVTEEPTADLNNEFQYFGSPAGVGDITGTAGWGNVEELVFNSDSTLSQPPIDTITSITLHVDSSDNRDALITALQNRADFDFVRINNSFFIPYTPFPGYGTFTVGTIEAEAGTGRDSLIINLTYIDDDPIFADGAVFRNYSGDSLTVANFAGWVVSAGTIAELLNRRPTAGEVETLPEYGSVGSESGYRTAFFFDAGDGTDPTSVSSFNRDSWLTANAIAMYQGLSISNRVDEAGQRATLEGIVNRGGTLATQRTNNVSTSSDSVDAAIGAVWRANPDSIFEVNGQYYFRIEPLFFDPTNYRINNNPAVLVGSTDAFMFVLRNVDVTEETSSSSIIVSTDTRADFQPPTIALTTRGSAANPPGFTVSTLVDGRPGVSGAGRPTEYEVTLNGAVVADGELTETTSLSTVSAEINDAIDALTTHTSMVAGNVINSTSLGNVSDNLAIRLIPGINRDGVTTGNDLAVTREVRQSGRAESMAGTDGTVTVMSGTDVLGVVNGAGKSESVIAEEIRQLFIASSQWNAGTLFTNQFTLTSIFLGTTPAPSFVVNPGVQVDVSTGILTSGTLAVDLDTINNGDLVTFVGEPTQLTITTGTITRVITLSSQQTAVQSAQALVNEVNLLQAFNAEITTGSMVRVTSVRAEVTDDIEVSVTQIGTDGTTTVTRTLVQPGQDPRVDFSTTVWTYYVINQEVRVDDDSVAMMTDNTITIPRGLVVDSEQIQTQGSTAVILAAEMYSTAAHRSNLVLTGGVSEPLLITNTGTDTRQYALDWSLDGNVWTQVLVTQAFNPNFGGTANGQIYNNIQFIGGQINDVPASSTVHFRARRLGGVTALGSWGIGFLIIEERNVDMT